MKSETVKSEAVKSETVKSETIKSETVKGGTADNNILEIRNLTKDFEGFSLQSINLQLPPGCVMGVIGENGAGKSTMIKAIMGLIRANEGEVYFFGVPEKRSGRSERTERKEIEESVKDDIGVVLGGVCLPTAMNGIQISRMMAGVYRNWNQDLFYEYLRRFGIERKKKIKDYSKGMGIKAAIAIALSHKARLLILDEPTDGLDPVAREELLDILREFVMDENHSVLISSHIISDLEKIVDYVVFLNRGELVFCEEKDRLLEEYRILKGSRADIETEAACGNIQMIGMQENSFGASALVKLKRQFRPERPIAVEAAGLEDIMIYLVKKERSGRI